MQTANFWSPRGYNFQLILREKNNKKILCYKVEQIDRRSQKNSASINGKVIPEMEAYFPEHD